MFANTNKCLLLLHKLCVLKSTKYQYYHIKHFYRTAVLHGALTTDKVNNKSFSSRKNENQLDLITNNEDNQVDLKPSLKAKHKITVPQQAAVELDKDKRNNEDRVTSSNKRHLRLTRRTRRDQFVQKSSWKTKNEIDTSKIQKYLKWKVKDKLSGDNYNEHRTQFIQKSSWQTRSERSIPKFRIAKQIKNELNHAATCDNEEDQVDLKPSLKATHKVRVPRQEATEQENGKTNSKDRTFSSKTNNLHLTRKTGGDSFVRKPSWKTKNETDTSQDKQYTEWEVQDNGDNYNEHGTERQTTHTLGRTSRMARTTPDRKRTLQQYGDRCKDPPQSTTLPPMQIKGEILFGQFPVLLALKSKRRQIHKLYMRQKKMTENKGHYSEIVSLAQENNIEIETCNRQVLFTLSRDRPHQSVCLDVESLRPEPFQYEQLAGLQNTGEENEHTSKNTWLFMDEIQDPMNFGAILRTSCFMGIDRVIVPIINSCSLSPEVSKASAGSVEIMNLNSVADKFDFFSRLKDEKWTIIGTVGRTCQPGYDDKHVDLESLTSLPGNCIVIMGNEGVGLPTRMLDLCTTLVSISPGKDNIIQDLDSVNVSVATGIVLYHIAALRARQQSTSNSTSDIA